MAEPKITNCYAVSLKVNKPFELPVVVNELHKGCDNKYLLAVTIGDNKPLLLTYEKAFEVLGIKTTDV